MHIRAFNLTQRGERGLSLGECFKSVICFHSISPTPQTLIRCQGLKTQHRCKSKTIKCRICIAFFFFLMSCKLWPRRPSLFPPNKHLNRWTHVSACYLVAHSGWRWSRRCYLMLQVLLVSLYCQQLDARFAHSHPRLIPTSRPAPLSFWFVCATTVVVFPPVEH